MSESNRTESAKQKSADAISEVAPRRPARAELIWEGKYDADGKRAAPVRVALPFQTVETVNESVQERQRGFMFESPSAYHAKEWRNRLIWGDKKYVLPSLVAEFAGKVNLIYIDPPFDTGADFSYNATIPAAVAGRTSASPSTSRPTFVAHKPCGTTRAAGWTPHCRW